MKHPIRCCLFFILAHLATSVASGQYYYKDIILTAESNHTFDIYLKNKVKAVKLIPSDGSSTPTEDFVGEQKVSYRPNKIVTFTRAAGFGESVLTAWYDANALLIKSSDSTALAVSTSYYTYNAAHQLEQLKNETMSSDKSSVATEVHTWKYDEKGRPKQMISIKNSTDTLLVSFKLDEKGNVEEEESFRKNHSQGGIYYYYDDQNRLTDVVRYNERSNTLLPDYILEYEDSGELSALTIFPERGSLQKWYYNYADNGLKLAEFCYNKAEVLQAKIEYSYSF